MFWVKPSAFIRMKVPVIEVGITRALMKVLRRLRKDPDNQNRQSTAKQPVELHLPYGMVHESQLAWAISSVTPCGPSSDRSVSTCALTALATSTVFVPD